jgi:hypothetical protein
MPLEKRVNWARIGSRVAGLALALGLAAGLAAQAVPANAAIAPASVSAHAAGGRAVAFRQAIAIPAGSRHVAGSAHGVAYSITTAKASPQTSPPCTLTVYDPYWYGGDNNNYVQASAYVICDERVSTISVTVALFSGETTYTLLGEATTTVDNTNGVFGVYNYEIYAYGYYLTCAIGAAGANLNYNVPEGCSFPATYISWLT